MGKGGGAYQCEVHEMLEASIQVGLLLQGTHTPEVGVVDVGVHPKEPLEDGLNYLNEVWWKGFAVLLRE